MPATTSTSDPEGNDPMADTTCDHCLPVDDYYLDCILDADNGHTEHQTADGRRFAIRTIDGAPFMP